MGFILDIPQYGLTKHFGGYTSSFPKAFWASSISYAYGYLMFDISTLGFVVYVRRIWYSFRTIVGSGIVCDSSGKIVCEVALIHDCVNPCVFVSYEWYYGALCICSCWKSFCSPREGPIFIKLKDFGIRFGKSIPFWNKWTYFGLLNPNFEPMHIDFV